MTNPSPNPTKPRRPSREEIAREEIGHTDVSNGVKWFLAIFFLAVIALVPLLQVALDIRAHSAGTRESALPGGLDLAREIASALDGDSQARGRDATAFDRALDENRKVMGALHSHEDALADDSWLSSLALTPMQTFFADAFGVGNEEAYLGRDGMLFYRTDLEHLWGRGFLEDSALRSRRAAGTEWKPAAQPDPLPAILQLASDLDARGIRLVVVPAPLKATILPGAYTRRAIVADGEPALNASFQQFTNELANPALFLDGRLQSYPEIARNPAWRQYAAAYTNLLAAREALAARPPIVFDATSALLAEHAERRSVYLNGDTHWTPQGMEAVAKELAAAVRGLLPGDPSGPGMTALPRVAVTNVGDTAKMLKVPDGHRLREPEVALIRPVMPQPAVSAPPARVMLLGDSFSNIYSQEGLGWGTNAGLAEQLSLELGEPVIRIAINAGGAHAARMELAQRVARAAASSAPDPLAQVKVVVYEFAMRELSSGDWKLISMDAGTGGSASGTIAEQGGQPTQPAPAKSADGAMRVTGRIADLTHPPAPESVPYEDAVVNVHLTDLKWDGEAPADAPEEMLVYAWGMQKRAWRPLAKMKQGDEIEFEVVPWETVMDDYGSYNRTDFEDFDLLMLPAYWGEPAKK